MIWDEIVKAFANLVVDAIYPVMPRVDTLFTNLAGNFESAFAVVQPYMVAANAFWDITAMIGFAIALWGYRAAANIFMAVKWALRWK